MGIKNGKLVRRDDAKGFSFIKPENGKGDIFIHITVLQDMGRKPVLGGIIHYEIGTDTMVKVQPIRQIERFQ